VEEVARRSGPFAPGDRVQLSDRKGRRHTVWLEPGRVFHTHHGQIAHDDLLGRPDGSVVTSSTGTVYLALRPLLSDVTLAMPRGATVVYPKDAAAILGLADIGPGDTVVEA
jgi:tRNA (adenine57-N1/adenine58-N1)-methyltransferase catalytic subunit